MCVGSSHPLNSTAGCFFFFYSSAKKKKKKSASSSFYLASSSSPSGCIASCRARWHFIFWVHNFHKIIIKIGAKWSSHLEKWLQNYRARKWSARTCRDLNKHSFLIRFWPDVLPPNAEFRCSLFSVCCYSDECLMMVSRAEVDERHSETQFSCLW